jgi:hypothetical protein
MAILKRSAGKINMAKVDLSLKGVLMLVVAFAVLLGAFGGGKWLLGKGKAVVQGVVPQASGAGDLEAELGL